MKEYKFRHWDTFDKKEPKMVYFNFNKLIAGSVYPDKETIMQYTGLKDKDGKEIYEGDITDNYGYIITWVDGSDPANLGMPVGWYEQRDNFESYRQLEVGDKIEVLGNIYENPELLNTKPI